MTRIAQAVEAWPGVTAAAGTRGDYSFKVGVREIGHLHGPSCGLQSDRVVARHGLP